jgi:hypothetical protein
MRLRVPQQRPKICAGCEFNLPERVGEYYGKGTCQRWNFPISGFNTACDWRSETPLDQVKRCAIIQMDKDTNKHQQEYQARLRPKARALPHVQDDLFDT